MSARAKILMDMYRRGKVTREGLEKAAEDGVITEQELRVMLDGE